MAHSGWFEEAANITFKYINSIKSRNRSWSLCTHCAASPPSLAIGPPTATGLPNTPGAQKSTKHITFTLCTLLPLGPRHVQTFSTPRGEMLFEQPWVPECLVAQLCSKRCFSGLALCACKSTSIACFWSVSYKRVIYPSTYLPIYLSIYLLSTLCISIYVHTTPNYTILFHSIPPHPINCICSYMDLFVEIQRYMKYT